MITVLRKNSNVTVIFDGYSNGQTAMDVIHNSQREVVFDKFTKFVSAKDEFLSNLKNKELFIRLLGETLKENG